jgi:hypothetical protein
MADEVSVKAVEEAIGGMVRPRPGNAGVSGLQAQNVYGQLNQGAQQSIRELLTDLRRHLAAADRVAEVIQTRLG